MDVHKGLDYLSKTANAISNILYWGTAEKKVAEAKDIWLWISGGVVVSLTLLFIIYKSLKKNKNNSRIINHNTVAYINSLSKAPEKFQLGRNINEWLDDLEEHLDCLNITSVDQRIKYALKQMGEGPRTLIREEFELNKPKADTDWKEIRTRIARVLKASKEGRIKFDVRHQKQGETLAEFGVELAMLISEQYPNVEPETKRAMLFRQFCAGMLDLNKAEALRKQPPMSIPEAIDWTNNQHDEDHIL